MMLNSMSIDDLMVQFSGPMMKRFEPSPHPLWRVFTTCLGWDQCCSWRALQVLPIPNALCMVHVFLDAHCILGTVPHVTPPRSSSQLDLHSSQPPQSVRLYQENLNTAFSWYALAAIAAYAPCFP